MDGVCGAAAAALDPTCGASTDADGAAIGELAGGGAGASALIIGAVVVPVAGGGGSRSAAADDALERTLDVVSSAGSVVVIVAACAVCARARSATMMRIPPIAANMPRPITMPMKGELETGCGGPPSHAAFRLDCGALRGAPM